MKRILLWALLAGPLWAQPGLHFERIEGARSTPVSAKVSTSPLPLNQFEELLSRLPALPPASVKAFVFQPSRPPPKSGRRIQEPFPPLKSEAPSRPVSSEAPLQILSYAPRGSVQVANEVHITFNRPPAPKPSAQLTPPTPGQWRWLTSQELVFQPETRLPMATEFQVSLPGSVWSFATPAAQLTEHYPEGNQVGLQPVIYLEFNQKIEARSVLPLVTLDGYPLRSATPEEIAADAEVQQRVKKARPDRWLAAVPVEPLRPGSLCTVRLLKGLPSAEGPLTTSKTQSFKFRTIPPLTIERESRGTSSAFVTFSNPLAPQEVSLSSTPDIPKLQGLIQENQLFIRGELKPETSYQITVPPGIRDIFGQVSRTGTVLKLRTGEMGPGFQHPSQELLTLNSSDPPEVYFRLRGYKKLRVQIAAAEPGQWQRLRGWSKKEPPGPLLRDQEIAGEQIALNLAEEFKKSRMLWVRATPVVLTGKETPSYQGLVQRSSLDLTVASEDDQLLAWVTRLSDGSPVSGVRVSQPDGTQSAQTDAQGLARLIRSQKDEALLVQDGDTQLLLPLSVYYNPGAKRDVEQRWFVTEDRKLYKPGETVSIKGWLRLEPHQPRSRLQLPPHSRVSYTLYDANHEKLAQGETTMGHLASFQFQVPLPRKIEHLGRAQLEILAAPYSTRHSFQIQEFRAPEFEASTQAEASSAVVGGTGAFRVQASYFAGGALKNSPVSWKITAQTGHYTPPHWDGFQFGEARSWWSYRDQEQAVQKTFGDTVTDADGKETLNLRFLSVDKPQPYVVVAEATVKDANQRAWSSSDTMLVHPARHYVGLKAGLAFVEAGKTLELQMVSTDLDGKATPGLPIELAIQKRQEDGQYVEASRQALTSSSGPVSLSLPFSESGLYKIQATLRDQDNRSNRSSLAIWVAGGQARAHSVGLETQRLILIPEKKSYQPGETARILVQAPFPKGHLLVTQARFGLAGQQTLPLDGGHAIVNLPLTESDLPNVHVRVQAVGQMAQAEAELNLEISPSGRELRVEIQPAQEALLPGATSQVEIRLKDARNLPVANGDVALLAIDEALLALSDATETNLLSTFYPSHAGEVQHYNSRRYLQLPLPSHLTSAGTGISPFELIGSRPSGIGSFQGARAFPLDIGTFQSGAAGGAANVTYLENARSGLATIGLGYAGGGEGTVRPGVSGTVSLQDRKLFDPIQLRRDFTPLACFLPSLRSDANGRVQASFKLPDNLTRYRLIALAAADLDHFGKGQANLSARQPLMLRPSPPRFLNLGDQARLPVLVQNQSDHAQRVNLACRASNLKVDSPGLQFEIPAHDRVGVSFPIAAEKPGLAQVQFAVSSENFADAATSEIPVLTPASSEGYATYGTLDEGTVTQPVTIPEGTDSNFGGLEVSTSSTALSELTDAFLYLRNYPHECTEQLSSRVLSTVALEPVLRAFQTNELPSPQALKQSVQADLKKLQSLQNSDGGWDYWERGRPSLPFPSLHVAHALVRLRQAGYPVDEHLLEKTLAYAANFSPARDTSAENELALRSYAVYVLNRAGRPQRARARQLLQQRGLEQTPLECLGWLLPSLAGQPEEAAVLRLLANRVRQTASTAEFLTNYSKDDQSTLASNRRDDAILLEALLVHDSPLAPKLVRGLLEHRQRGRWENTQENCWVLLGLQAYFRKYENAKPDFLARLWLGEAYAGEQAFRGYHADSHELRIPIGQLKGDLTLSKEGSGRLYYRVGLQSTPLGHQLPALERGFSVSRLYESASDQDEVSRDQAGNWRIKAGSRVKVTVTMTAPANRYHVALVDPLPAGLEVINPVLKGGQQSQDSHAYWYQHENLRDDRVEAFTYRLSGGTYQYSYYARAITPGQFTAPPARAEQMYHPETFGRCATDRVTVIP